MSLGRARGKRGTNGRHQVKGSLPPPADISGYKSGKRTASSAGDTPSSVPTKLDALPHGVASAWVHRGTRI